MATLAKKYLRVSKGGISAVVITPQTVDANGGLSDTTPVATCTAVLKSLNLELAAEKENISASTSPRANHVVIEDDIRFSVSILKVDDGSDPDPLLSALAASEIFKLTFTEGSASGSVKVRTFYGSRGSYSAAVEGKGSVMGTLSFDAVDVGGTDFFVTA